jgi:hypothetical protein
MPHKTALRVHLTPIRLIIIKKTNNNKCWQRCGGIKEPSHTIGGNVNYGNMEPPHTMEISVEVPQ